MAGFDLRNILRRTLGYDHSAVDAAFRSQIDDPIRGFNHLEVMLNDDQSISLVPKFDQDIQLLADIGEMKTSGRLIQDIHGASRGLLCELGR